MGEKDDTKKEAGDEKKPDGGPITVVLKLDLHCDGCVKKITKSIRHIEGVEHVKADTAHNKLTVTGKVDPTRIKERVESKTKKKVEIISPQPKKDGGEEKKKTGDNPPEKKPEEKKPEEKKPEEKKPKVQASTVVLKIPLHCDGCIHKIKRQISKIDGVETVLPDAGKDLVTVKGTMNMNEVIPHLKEKLKRSVDIVPPKKDEKGGDTKDEKKDDKKEKVEGGGDKKEKKEGGGGGGGEVKALEGGGGDLKALEGGGGGGGEDKKKGLEVVNKFEHQGQNPYTYTMQMYNQNYYNQDYGVLPSSSQGYVHEGYNHGHAMAYSHPPPMPPPTYLHDPRGYQYQPDNRGYQYQPETGMFSDENPNACSVM